MLAVHAMRLQSLQKLSAGCIARSAGYEQQARGGREGGRKGGMSSETGGLGRIEDSVDGPCSDSSCGPHAGRQASCTSHISSR